MKKYLDSRLVLILCFVVFGLFKGLAQNIPPVLSNFRIENNNKNRVYFDSSEPISGSSFKGFKITGEKVNGIKINSGSKTGHYISIAGSFDFWDNNTIRYEGGSNIKSNSSGLLNEFTLEYIENKIPEPEGRGNTYYVSTSGRDSNSGTSQGESWRTISHAANKAKVGDIVYIKAGDYGNENIDVKNSGKANNPIKFIGYKTTPGDRPTLKRSQTTSFSASQMPYIHSSKNGGSGFSAFNKSYIIIRNIQVEGYENSIDIGKSSYTIVDNCYAKNGRTNISNFPHFTSVQNRVINSFVSNGSHNGVYMTGSRHLIDNVFASSKGKPDMDYYLVIVGGNVGIGEHIIRNCEVVRDLNDSHPGHGISLKAQGRDIGYSLVEKSRIINVGMSLEARHSGSMNNVYKDIFIGNNGPTSGIGIQITSAQTSIFERIHVEKKSYAIKFLGSTEDIDAKDAGNGNLIRNCIFTKNSVNINIVEDLGKKNRSPRNNTILNSVFDNALFMYSIESNDKGKNNQIVNSILFNITDEFNRGSGDRFDFIYSNFYSSTGSKWSSKAQSGLGNIVFDPSFVNYSKGDFRLKSNSPLIDKGKSFDNIRSDYDRNHRPNGKSNDIGAFEFHDTSKRTILADAGEDLVMCQGDEVVLSASGGNKYLWDSGQKTSSITVSPDKTTTYTVTVTDGVTTDEDEVTVTVNEVNANAGKDVTINQGDEVTLTASGGDTYLWSTGETTANITVSPEASKTYEVTVGSNGCEDTDRVRVKVEDKLPPVVADAGKDISICSGEEVVLTATGGSTYSWNTGGSASSITVSPDKTTTYTVTVTDGVTTDEDEVTVTVNEVNANAGKDLMINQGDEVTLTASGGDTYLWSTGETTANITVSPEASKTYEVTVGSNGCEDTDRVRVKVEDKLPPVVADAGKDISICSGEEVVLTATGGSTYSWNTGGSASSITVSPDKTTTYTVTVTDGVTTDEDEVTVTVNEVNANAGKDVTINQGDEVILTASGGDTYLWSTGETTANITVSPEASKTYEVTVGSNGCEDTDRVRVKVENKLPPVVADTSKDISICSGEEVVLTATGGSTYLWNTGGSTSSITVSPTKTTTYTVTVTDGVTIDEDEVTVIVNEVNANAGKDVTINQGDEVTLTASGGDIYLWSTGETTANITVSPEASKTYEVTVGSNGCEDTDQIRVRVENNNPDIIPVVADAGKDISICSGEEVVLTATGGSTYLWNTGGSTSSITVSPDKTTTYTVTVTDGVTTDEAEVTVTVNTVEADVGENRTIDAGDSITLTASGGDYYKWSNGETSKSITMSPTETKIYTVTAFRNGCYDTSKVQITVNQQIKVDDLIIPKVDAGEDVTICSGQSTTLNATGEGSFLWSTGDQSSLVKVSPKRTTTYTVQAQKGDIIVTDTIVVYVESCPGTYNKITDLKLVVYPNPSNGLVKLNITGAEKTLDMEVFDMNGRLIHKEKIDARYEQINKDIDLSRLPKGMYLLRLHNMEQNVVSKILFV
ncbi:T9SS type A sorting domain-containing protein [Lutimonas vermicola]|uniref:T9SS type A sorting domain-containing protein n=1 Tax=Lutimonas vermicola TaxID=414288 RepID=A0ABU9KZ65_9FLAO